MFSYLLMYSEACSHYFIIIQRVLVDESLDEFFRSDVTQSFLKREKEKSLRIHEQFASHQDRKRFSHQMVSLLVQS